MRFTSMLMPTQLTTSSNELPASSDRVRLTKSASVLLSLRGLGFWSSSPTVPPVVPALGPGDHMTATALAVSVGAVLQLTPAVTPTLLPHTCRKIDGDTPSAV